MGGLELCQQALERNPAIKLVTITGYNSDGAEGRTDATDFGHVHLRKPFTIADLRSELAKLEERDV